MCLSSYKKHILDVNRIMRHVIVALIGTVTLFTVILSIVPPTDRDSLTHHLFIPKLYIQQGGIHEIPDIAFSYYPMNLELLYLIPLSFGNDIIPKYIHFLFALLTALLIYRFLKPRTSTNIALFGSLLLLSTPIVVKLSTTAYVDLGLMFFSTASLLLILRWLESDAKRHLILAGICCGLAAGTKYNGIVSIIVLSLLLPIFSIHRQNRAPGSDRKALAAGCIFLLCALLTFSPWMVRNFIWTGNPIYPLHDTLFNSVTSHNTHSISEAAPSDSPSPTMNPFVFRRLAYQEPWWQTMLLPVRFFFEGRDDDPRYFDGKLNPFLLILPLLAFLYPPTTRQARHKRQFLMAFSLLLFLFTFFQQVPRIRYIIGVVPPLVLLSAYGLHQTLSASAAGTSLKNHPISRSLVAVCAIGALAYNLQYLSSQFTLIKPLTYITGKVSREQYITSYRPEYPAIQFINQLQQPIKTLAIFLGNRGYYFDTPVVFDLQNNRSTLLELTKHSADGQHMYKALTARQITHLIIRFDLFEQYVQQNLSPVETNRLSKFFQEHTRLVFSKNNHGVFLLQEPK
ncbi:MAG: phospholipid carrier-dependent glycosyltransferase [Desulfobulbaceae bacterium]|nr:MAG: phospholipid carrier-dependent glycosyltransferase [Desulfobulbaceae bacterium]